MHYKLGAPDVLVLANNGGLHGTVDEFLAVLSNARGNPIADFAVAVDRRTVGACCTSFPRGRHLQGSTGRRSGSSAG